jgi:putative redox protein
VIVSLRKASGEAAMKLELVATARSIPGTLRQEVLIDGRHRLITDQPEEIGGEGSAPSPHELLPAALAACISSTLVRYARTKHWELGHVTVEVRYDKSTTPRQFEIDIRFGRELGDEQIDRLRKVAGSCPLRRSLAAGFAFTERIDVGALSKP